LRLVCPGGGCPTTPDSLPKETSAEEKITCQVWEGLQTYPLFIYAGPPPEGFLEQRRSHPVCVGLRRARILIRDRNQEGDSRCRHEV
jgi:hypothetical protein